MHWEISIHSLLSWHYHITEWLGAVLSTKTCVHPLPISGFIPIPHSGFYRVPSILDTHYGMSMVPH